MSRVALAQQAALAGGGMALPLRRAVARASRAGRRAVGRALYRVDGPVLVFQMGKVGSTAVYDSLRSAGLREVEQVHVLTRFDELEARVRTDFPAPRPTLREIDRGRELRRRLDAAPEEPWTVVSLVRDPVARNVSAFFQSVTELVPHAREAPDVDELVEAFGSLFPHDDVLIWFPTQFVPVLGIDVFAVPFDHHAGYQRYESAHARAVVIRAEDLDASWSAATRELFGRSMPRLPRSNQSADKWYAPLLPEFRRRLRLSDAYLDRMYDSTVARHFYRPEELARFRSRWTADEPS